MICLLLFLFSNSKSTAHYLTEIWTGVKGSKAKTCSKFYYSNIYQLLNTSTGTRNYILMLKYLQSSLFSAFIQSIQCIKSTTSISFHTTCITVHYFPWTFRVTVYCGIFVTWWAWAGLVGGGVRIWQWHTLWRILWIVLCSSVSVFWTNGIYRLSEIEFITGFKA